MTILSKYHARLLTCCHEVIFVQSSHFDLGVAEKSMQCLKQKVSSGEQEGN